MSTSPTPLALEHAFLVIVGTQILGAFMEVSGIGVSRHMYDYEEGGNNDFVHRLPGRTVQQNLTLKAGLTRQPVLLSWANRQDAYTAPETLSLCYTDPSGEPFTWFRFMNAVPVRWTGPSANISANAVATESLEIAHQGMI